MIAGDQVLIDGQRPAVYVGEITRHHSEVRLAYDAPGITRTLTTDRLSLAVLPASVASTPDAGEPLSTEANPEPVRASTASAASAGESS